MLNKCVFLDRDGVINVERGDYTYRVEDFVLEDGVAEALSLLKEKSYLLILVTNQAGLARGLYTREQMRACHTKMNEETAYLIDDIYYSPYHPSVTQSLSRKPGTLMMERAIAKYKLDPASSWLIGDRERDIEAAQKLGIRTIRVDDIDNNSTADYSCKNLLEATKKVILK